ncbi:uncharacterized protein IUM83_14019 [Phytophthora cinnamomi]|uniref:uncharacterized protein n=1 Tax=Phytophthora cinnamomi TaxID=4785 RepID=UPI00355A37B7|nr:hypothetical protein IUM83_14019 [Phytophthora cinnamomi]
MYSSWINGGKILIVVYLCLLVKLLPIFGWRHIPQALSKKDPSELARVFTEIKGLAATAVDTQVRVFGYGAPLQFNTFGFFDKTSSVSSAIFERVVEGDTMLLLALRHHNPLCAITLLKLGASFHTSNSIAEYPLRVIFDAMAFFRLHPAGSKEEHARCPSNPDDKLLELRTEYEALFSILTEELSVFYKSKRETAERELRDLYQQCAPDRVSKIPSQLEAYAYREHILLEDVKKKYLS